MSGGQFLGGAIGAVAGFFFGGPMGALKGAQLGMGIGGMLDPPKGPNIEGPRLSDLSAQTSTYGASIPRGYGTFPVLGNVFWLENNKIKEVKTKTKSGGKGGQPKSTTTTYSYFGTFAVGLCKGPISGVRRIWVGSKLIYDAGAIIDNIPGPNSTLSSRSGSAKAAGTFTVYPGSETQNPSSRMQSTLGAANTPAYRGLAYIVFHDFPLADYGNSIAAAQVKVEVVVDNDIVPIVFAKNPDMVALNPYQPNIGAARMDANGYTWKLSADGSKLYRVHVASGTITTVRPKGINNNSSLFIAGFDSDGNAVGYYQDTNEMTFIQPGGVENIVAAGNAIFSAFSTVPQMWVSTDGGTYLALYTMDGYYGYANAPISLHYHDICAGNVIGEWVHFVRQYEADKWQLMRYHMYLNIWEPLFDVEEHYDNGHDYFLIVAGSDGYFYTWNSTTNAAEKRNDAGTLIGTAPANTGFPVMFNAVGKLVTRVEITGESDNRFYVINTNDMSSLGYAEQVGGIQFDSGITGQMMVGDYTAVLIDIIPFGEEALSAILYNELMSSNLLTAGDIDVSEINQSVKGYRISGVSSIRSAIEQLQGCWPFDVIQHGYQIKFIPRGREIDDEIDGDDLDAVTIGDRHGAAIVNTREMESVLPTKVSVKYLDIEREYDVNEQYAERLNTQAVNQSVIDVSVILNSNEAAQIAEKLLYMYWMERNEITFKLPGIYNHLEPSDVVKIVTDTAEYVVRITSITYTQDSRLECTAKYHSAATYTSNAVGEAGGGATAGKAYEAAVSYQIDSTFELMDIPAIVSTADQPGYPVIVGGYTDAWDGATLYTTIDNGQSWTTMQGFTPPGATIGICANTIGAGRVDLIDKSSVMEVYLRTGELSSTTEANMLNGENMFAYGRHGRWEIIGAQNCILQPDGTYLVSDLLRGRFGTEWACGLHADTDSVILLETTTPFLSTNINYINQTKLFRCVTNGNLLSDAIDTSFTYTGVNLECYAPVYLNGVIEPSTDWTLTWVRRTRVGGEMRDYVEVSLGEETEAYQIDIFANSSFDTVVRTISVNTTTATYTGTDQVTDFGGAQNTLYLKIYQMSATVGRGYPLTETITR